MHVMLTTGCALIGQICYIFVFREISGYCKCMYDVDDRVCTYRSDMLYFCFQGNTWIV